MNVRIMPANWNPVTERFISQALGATTLADMKQQVTDGAKLFKVVNQYVETVAAFILRIDELAEESQGVIVAAGGKADFDLTKTVLPAIERMFLDVQSIRIHTQRVGLVKKLAAQQYGGAEFVLIKRLKNGR